MEPNSDVIPWYASKIIWAQIIAVVFGALTYLWPGLVEEIGISQEEALTFVLVVVAVFTGIKRYGPTPDVTSTAAKAQALMSANLRPEEPTPPAGHEAVETLAPEAPTTAASPHRFSGAGLQREARRRKGD
jgi:hypothetical protein